MRLLRLKPYRAIPELDHFSDEQCRQFMGAARASWRGRAQRATFLVAAMIVIMISSTAALVLIWRLLGHRPVIPGDDFFFQVVVSAIVGISTGLFGGLIVNDRLLRRCIRRLIRDCGSCPGCQYTLVGMPVNAERCVKCPECGREIDADESMGEIALNDRGERAYLPRVARVDSRSAQRRRQRHRRFVAWTLSATTAFLLISGAAYGLFFWSLARQAERARSERHTARDIEAARALMWPNGRTAESAAEWATFERTLRAFTELGDRLTQESRESGEDKGALYFDPMSLDPKMNEATYLQSRPRQSLAVNRQFAERFLECAKKEGLLDRLATLRDLNAPMRTLEFDEEHQMFFTVPISGGMETRQVARVCLGRMFVAKSANDPDAYTQALDDALTASNIISRQGFLADWMVGIAVDTFVLTAVRDQMASFPDSAWHARVLDVLRRHGDRPTLIDAHRCERISMRDATQVFYSSPSDVQRTMIGLDWLQLVPAANPFKRRIGNYEESMKLIDTHFDKWIAYAKSATPGPAPGAITGCVVADVLAPWSARAAGNEVGTLEVRRRVVLGLACEVYRQRHGQWPDRMDEVAELLPDRSFLIDPTLRKPFTLAGPKRRAALVSSLELILAGDTPAEEAPAEPGETPAGP